MKFKAVLFDLDGTLLDTLKDLADSMNLALEQLGFKTHPAEAYKYIVGDGIETMARRALPENNRDSKSISKCIELTRQNYSRLWSVNTKPYPQITELLNELQKRNITMAVLSNKPDDFTKKMTVHFLGDYDFKEIRGAGPQTPIKPNPSAALRIAAQNQISPEQFVYLGDTGTDMKTAVVAGMYPVGVLWGFRKADELIKTGAKLLIKNPLEVLRLFEKD
ncbi:MAG: HAD family hydrolase [Phycisphaerae bacterium]